MSLLSDSMLAVTGLFPSSITDRDHVRAAKLPEQWERRLRAWVAAEAPAPFTYREPPKDIEAVFLRCQAPLDQQQAAGWLEALGLQDLGPDYLLAVARARQHMVAIWPALTLVDSATPEVLPLAADEAGDMAAVFALLDDPGVLLDDMDQHTLEPLQATAFRACYPELYDWMGATLERLIVDQRAKHPDWRSSWQQDAVLRVLKGMPPEVPIKAPVQQVKPMPKLDMGSDKLRTQAELAQQPIGAENPTGK